jgi:hypothetical protein
MLGTVAALWGVTGVLGLLTWAIVRLTPIAVSALGSGLLSPTQWLITGLWVGLMLWMEGYRGFHCAFAPRVGARALWLRRNPRPIHVALAPLFHMGYIHATESRRWRSLGLTGAIILLVILVRGLEQPWRGIVDAGVVVGLAAGVTSVAWHVTVALRTGVSPTDPEVPLAPRGGRL